MENAQKQPTEFGVRLLTEMRNANLRAAGLARAADVSPSTITRLIYGGVDRPDEATIGKIAQALAYAIAGPTADPALVEAKRQELLQASGHQPGMAAMMTFDSDVVEYQLMIGPGTLLDPDEVAFLRTMHRRLIEPYRKKMGWRAG